MGGYQDELVGAGRPGDWPDPWFGQNACEQDWQGRDLGCGFGSIALRQHKGSSEYRLAIVAWAKRAERLAARSAEQLSQRSLYR